MSFAFELSECRFGLRGMSPTRRDLLSESLSTRLDLMEAVLELAESSEDDWVFPSIATTDAVEGLRELNRLRNTVSHDNTMSERQAEAFYYETKGKVLSVLAETRALEETMMIRCLGSRGALTRLSCEVFSGFETERTIESLELPPRTPCRHSRVSPVSRPY